MGGKWKVRPRTQKNRQRNTGLVSTMYPRRAGRPIGPAWKLLVVVGSEAPLMILRNAARLVAGPSVGFNPPQIDPTNT